MAKKAKDSVTANERTPKTKGETSKPLLAQEASVDATLAALFASSAGPVQVPPRSRYDQPPPQVSRRSVTDDNDNNGEGSEDEEEEDDTVEGDVEDLSSIEGEFEEDAVLELLAAEDDEDEVVSVENAPSIAADGTDIAATQPRKRKRNAGGDADDLEGQYMLKLAREEEKEEAERKAERKLKKQRLMAEKDPNMSEESEDLEDGSESDASESKVKPLSAPLDVPLHETLRPDKESTEIEKASRTVFLANVSTACITDKKAKKDLIDHMESFFESIPPPKDAKSKHKVESIRFRSTAYAGGGLPKKAAFATKSLMDSTTKSTNAYVVYTTAFAAREAVKRLNATIVLDRHLRVDGVAHPAKTDHRRCVFVGNLGFVDDESMMDQGGEGDRKRSKIPSDIEEGLWRQFGKAGKVESVRVVRDEKTRVGKGFAYVQFEDQNSVEAALLFNEKKYPPMLPRVLRVTRAKAMNKTALASQRAIKPQQRPHPGGSSNPNNTTIYNPKMSSQQQSLQGRASKLLGKAGAAQFKKHDPLATREAKPRAGGESSIKAPENFVMEGYRASAKNGKPKDLKFGKSGSAKKGGKPKTKSAARASAWKKGGGGKAKK